MNIVVETRRASYDAVLVNLGERQQLVANALKDYEVGLTARELACILHSEGKIVTNDRNMVQPRLTELVKKGIVDVVGKRKDDLMNRNVAVYQLKNIKENV